MGADINIVPQRTSTKEKSPEGFPRAWLLFGISRSWIEDGAGPLPLPTTHEGTIAMGGREGKRAGYGTLRAKESAGAGSVRGESGASPDEEPQLAMPGPNSG